LPGGRREPRPLLTYVRYPALGARSGTDHRGAAAASAGGPFPLVVFGHGYAVTPVVYGRLLRAWTAAGYVVAAPEFPLENANAPGGPDETDLVNQPADLRFVITQLLAAAATPGNLLEGMIDPLRIAVAGHSDGAETALAVAYNHRFRDSRVRAAVILAGAEISRVGRYAFPPGSPALLAVQGTADKLNPPKFTYAFYDIASRPRFLLTLLGARHLAPYTYEQPQLGIVERVTTAFLDRYLKAGPLQPLIAAGTVPEIAELAAHP
jgi:dienelactone hydrolase